VGRNHRCPCGAAESSNAATAGVTLVGSHRAAARVRRIHLGTPRAGGCGRRLVPEYLGCPRVPYRGSREPRTLMPNNGTRWGRTQADDGSGARPARRTVLLSVASWASSGQYLLAVSGQILLAANTPRTTKRKVGRSRALLLRSVVLAGGRDHRVAIPQRVGGLDLAAGFYQFVEHAVDCTQPD